MKQNVFHADAAMTFALITPLFKFLFLAKKLALSAQSAKMKTAKNILMPKNVFFAENA